MPVCELSSQAPASLAIAEISAKIEKIINLFNQQSDQPTS